MKLDSKDLHHAKNLLKLMAKAEMKLDGAEVLAAGDAIKWLMRFEQGLTEELNPKKVEISSSPISESPKPKRSKRGE